MEQGTDHRPGVDPHLDNDYESQIAALDRAPTGAPFKTKDYVFLLITGVIIPVILLIWGWS
ncbi:MAG: hypothetical protein P1V34_03455 [Alphaproteobacteria bacterium]|nr:hypothetical protein [Alphaproteobacteria bacterium]